MRRKCGYKRNENEKSYLIKDFQKTVSRQFSAKSTELNTAFLNVSQCSAAKTVTLQRKNSGILKSRFFPESQFMKRFKLSVKGQGTASHTRLYGAARLQNEESISYVNAHSRSVPKSAGNFRQTDS